MDSTTGGVTEYACISATSCDASYTTPDPPTTRSGDMRWSICGDT